MLWLAIHLPLLSLEAFSATLTHPPEASSGAAATPPPVALVAEHHITAVNAEAAACGVRVGFKRATALALASDLVLGQANESRDAQAVLAVAHAALAFTPHVTLDGSGNSNIYSGTHTVLLEVQASLRYFGGPAKLLRQLIAALAPLGHQLQLASAPTALGAALLARWKSGLLQGPHSTQLPALQTLLGSAPVWLLGPGREHWAALQGMGLHTLSDLRHLPRTGLARRFGEGLLDDLDRALGLHPDPRQNIELPSRFAAQLELFARADTTAQVLHGATLLLAQLVAWVQAQRARVMAFTLVMRHEPERGKTTVAATDLRIELAQPSADGAHLQMLLRERLARLVLAAPTLELRLHCQHIARSEAPNGELFPSRQSESEGLARLIERLRARLGPEQVHGLVARQDHRPERATEKADLDLRPAGHALGTAALTNHLTQPRLASINTPLPQHRPVWLLPTPTPLADKGSLPWFDGHALHLLAGPERIESGWWEGDSALATRDYFIAQAHDFALVWIYRARLPQNDPTLPAAGWFLQGHFG